MIWVLKHRPGHAGRWLRLGAYGNERDASRAWWAYLNLLSGDWHTVSERASADRQAQVNAILGALKKRAPLPEQVPAAEAIARLEASGVALRVEDGSLKASGPLTDELRAFIRGHKELIVEHLTPEKPRFVCWSEASVVRLMADTRKEVQESLRFAGRSDRHPAFDAGFACMALALEWLADGIRCRNLERAVRHADYLRWLCQEMAGWADGSVELPPREALA